MFSSQVTLEDPTTLRPIPYNAPQILRLQQFRTAEPHPVTTLLTPALETALLALPQYRPTFCEKCALDPTPSFDFRPLGKPRVMEELTVLPLQKAMQQPSAPDSQIQDLTVKPTLWVPPVVHVFWVPW